MATRHPHPQPVDEVLLKNCLRMKALWKESRAEMVAAIGADNVRVITPLPNIQLNQIGWLSVARPGANTGNDAAIWHADELQAASARSPREIHIVKDVNRDMIIARIDFDSFLNRVKNTISSWEERQSNEYLDCVKEATIP